ncbi:MAG: iron ABC transporter permease [Acidobacteriota bacterium]|nr:iron ABC transporter permease [Acidobacteriota bacterium]
MKRSSILGLLGLAWVLALVLAPLVGSHPLSLAEVWNGDTTAGTIFWQLRLPRTLLALLAGGALAVCGLSYQTLFRNELAEPYTLGTAVGAALGAVLMIRWGGDFLQGLLGWAALPGIGIASFVGAVAASSVVYGLAVRRREAQGSTLLLAGIAVSLSATAVILFIQYLSDSTQTYRMVRWTMGGLAVVGYREVLWLLPWVLGGCGVLLALRWELNLLLTGEELAASRGVDLARLRRRVLAVTSLMVGALVAVAGPIGFVGLMVPHILRRFLGHDHLQLIPACLLAGGAFLAVCDAVARVVMAPAELPVGILTALLGGPFFLWLIFFERS